MIVNTGINWFIVDKTGHENLTKSFEIDSNEAFLGVKIINFRTKTTTSARAFPMISN